MKYICTIPPDDWQFVSMLKDLTGEQAWELVRIICGDRYENYCGDCPIWFYSAKESFRSLMQANDLDPVKNWVILELNQSNQ